MTQRVLHIDPFGGASGDMVLGALVGLGAPLEVVDQAVQAVGLAGVRLHTEHARRHGLRGVRAWFVDQEGAAVDRLEGGAAAGHSARSWSEIRESLQLSSLTPEVKQLAMRIFTRLAEAEAGVHGTELEQVHLHEVGATDSIADVVGVAAALDALKVDRISSGPIPLGGQQVCSAHGVLPSPAPATALLCVGAEVRGLDVQYECTTPTGAAILSTVASRFGALPSGQVRGVGVGLGRRDPRERANLLRMFLIEVGVGEATHEAAELVELCTNLDDESGEHCAHAIGGLLELGALDAWAVPATMKKGRPALVLHALVPAQLQEEAAEYLLATTSTFGVRGHAVNRQVLERRLAEVETEYGRVRVKQALSGAQVIKVKAEFDDCARLARDHGVPPRVVMQAAERAVTGGDER